MLFNAKFCWRFGNIIWSTIASSKFLPPSQLSPSVSFTVRIPSSDFSIAASKVPPPKSKTNQYTSFFFASSPYAVAAATGSCSNSTCLNPANLAAFIVDSFCGCRNLAGTVITTDEKFSSCIIDLSFFRTSADNSSGV